ncbi:Putative glycoside hydrolase, family 5, glycoside hydrolase superfamily [Septoria linicola]|uniref:glucan 1,3-beta-glucosidase n=1 Tax=Septoria linicola TaxID=215465 RepID=A0A9Q9AID5_9PEZI|nr:putative glycoside hydrolase, family 5, glycoside hydrolase superfamily [Septoria linicola]USW48339.1 Putative glycoside hydrolase, family 5, glycoside hydrolase superfamily [Septoria linicola]
MPSSSAQPSRDSPARRQRRRRTHHRTDSNGELLGRDYGRYESDVDDRDRSPTKWRSRTDDEDRRRRERRPERPPNSSRTRRAPESEYTTSGSGSRSAALSMDQLEKLDRLNKKLGYNDYDAPPRPRQQYVEVEVEVEDDQTRHSDLEREREDRRRERERRREERRRRRKEEERRAWLAGEGEDDEVPIRSAARTRSASNHDRKRDTRERRQHDEYNYIRDKRERPRKERKERRVASGQVLERGDPGEYDGGAYYSEKDDYSEDVRRRDGSDNSSNPYIDPEEEERKRKLRKKIFIGVGVFIVLLAIIIPVAVVVSKKNSSGGGGGSGGADNAASDSSGKPQNSNLDDISQDSIPAQYKGTWLDPFSWYDTEDFNVTFTDEMVGGLPVMGLMNEWDDSTRANDKVPPLNEEFKYGDMPVRGCNVGGWLSIEPFITPSLFASYRTSDNVVDEWTLTQRLGATNAKSTLEKHYSSWVTESTFQDLQAAGFDHVRIPFGYWAVTTYDGDPYVAQVSWRYLLRGIEWARKYGLRVNLDLHGAPGSQNGWNHSGHQGQIGWLNGTDGTTNGDRTIAIHKQLSEFFTQPRYKNLVTMYGLVNEPRMVELDQSTVLAWTQKAIDAIRDNNFTGVIIFGDGFMGLDNWQGKLTGNDNLLLDVHQYVIFNIDQIVLNHHDKLNFACAGWTQQALRSQNTATGFGPTLCGEWSQADTDCAKYLNNVGVGSRWEGTLNMVGTPGGSINGSILTPTCPTNNNPRCSCDGANADPANYSDSYKKWLLMFAEAQMHSFEQGWGWFYWTWQTESSAQWSYKAGLAAGTMPQLAYEREFDCSQDIPTFDDLPEYY